MTLELGGKSPIVVFADADLDRAVAAAVNTVAMNAGQVCSATTRLLVEASAHDEVVARVVEAVERLEPGVDFGPMITEAQYAEGARPLRGRARRGRGAGDRRRRLRRRAGRGRAVRAADRLRERRSASCASHARRSSAPSS